jgi:hypothetical protein
VTCRIGPGATGGPSRTFEYREGDRVFLVHWDPRETGTVIADRFEQWTTPAAELLDAAARARVFDGLWSVAPHAGITAVIDESSSLPCPVPVRWNRGTDGFLVDVHDGGQLEYMELGRGLLLRYEEKLGQLYVAYVQWPTSLRWTEPAGPIPTDHAARIRERLARASAHDLRIGGHLPWKLVIEPEVTTVTYVSPSHIDVQVGHRRVQVGGEANVTKPQAPYFVFSDTIRGWQAPHEHDAMSADDKESILRAIREHFEQKGMSYIVDPTDEQYRSW